MHKAFTMIELVFVIVIIGILSSIAIPRFAGTADSAYITKAQATLATVRSALATERQLRILRGDFTGIIDLASTDNTNNVFDTFSADRNGTTASIFDYPILKCATGQKACWEREDATHYKFKFPTNGEAKFILQNNRLDCDNDASDCKKITL